MKAMKEKIFDVKEKLMTSSMEVDYKNEFGISKDEYFEMIKAANQLLDDSIAEENIDFNDVAEDSKFIVTDDLELVYESIGFNKMKDAINKIQSLEEGDYVVCVCLDEKFKKNIAYTNVVVFMILEKVTGKHKNIKFSFEYNKNQQSLRIYKKA